MPKTAAQFDDWIAEKRKRPIGPCSDCGHRKELRQREPAPLCGACLEKLRRQEARENDPLAKHPDEKRRERRIRSEMNKVLNAVDALEGFIADQDIHELQRIAKHNLRSLLGGPDDGHGHEAGARDHDQDSGAIAETDG